MIKEGGGFCMTGDGSIQAKKEESPSVAKRSLVPPPRPFRALVLHSFSVSSVLPAKEKLMDTLMRYSFGLQIKEHRAFSPPMGSIVLLLGTSTAGKSSIIDAFLQKNRLARESGIDISARKDIVAQMSQQFPGEIQTIRDALGVSVTDTTILNCIVSRDPSSLCKKGATIAEKEAVRSAVQKIRQGFSHSDVDVGKIMFDEILCNSVQGIVTIFDHIDVEAVFSRVMNLHIQLPLEFALVYCPFKDLSDRMDKRNEKAEAAGTPLDIRRGTFPFKQFAHFFGPKKREGDPVLETLPRDVVVAEVSRHYRDDIEHRKVEDRDWYDRHLGHLQDKYKLSNEQDLLRKEEAEVVGAVLQDLGFTSDAIQSVEISPRPRTYRYLFNTSQLTSEEVATALSKGIRSDNPEHK